VTGRGRLIDLGCGTGELALRLCSSFRDVWAVDLEPEMVEVGRGEGGAGGHRQCALDGRPGRGPDRAARVVPVLDIGRRGCGARRRHRWLREAELRTALLAHDPTGRYRETLRFSTILAAK
jgi:hypothetical protein